MKTLSRGVVEFTSLIIVVLSCFHRVILRAICPSPTGSPSNASSIATLRSDVTV
jgi:hypothetical protein